MVPWCHWVSPHGSIVAIWERPTCSYALERHSAQHAHSTSASRNDMGHDWCPHGSHHPTMNGIWSIMATIRWCSIFPKWDSYKPLNEDQQRRKKKNLGRGSKIDHESRFCHWILNVLNLALKVWSETCPSRGGHKLIISRTSPDFSSAKRQPKVRQNRDPGESPNSPNETWTKAVVDINPNALGRIKNRP